MRYKFRAWHEGSPIGVDPQMIYEDRPGDCFTWKAQGQPLTIMQWTGLKDSKGVQIYEGDVVKHRPGTNYEIGIIRFGEYEQDGSGGEYGTSTCIGFYVDRHKVFPDDWEIELGEGPYERDEYKQVSPVSTEIEIIGNIYENPELINS